VSHSFGPSTLRRGKGHLHQASHRLRPRNDRLDTLRFWDQAVVIADSKLTSSAPSIARALGDAILDRTHR
jgi:hypothetical protein